MDNTGISDGLRARIAMERNGFRHTHSLGQNFIMDEGLIATLLDAAQVESSDNVLEIGPGAGVMTCALARRCKSVLAIELDHSLEPVLSEMLHHFENVHVAYCDALKVDIAALASEFFGGEPFYVVANLPYYITADIILKLLLANMPLKRITIMVQKEAAERIMSHPGEKQWCSLAATVQYFGQPQILMELPPEFFDPKPHVTSSFIRIDLYDERPVKPADEGLFLRLIGAAFAMRRKTLANNLKASLAMPQDAAREALALAGLDARVRGEALRLEQLAQLCDVLEKMAVR